MTKEMIFLVNGLDKVDYTRFWKRRFFNLKIITRIIKIIKKVCGIAVPGVPMVHVPKMLNILK